MSLVEAQPSAAIETRALSEEQTELLKRTIAKGTSNDEFALFVATCNRSGLDPFARQIFAVKRYDSKERRDVMAIQVAIDGLRLIADRTGKYAGQKPAEWCGDDGVWKDVWLSEEPPRAARVSVLRHDFSEPVTAVALWDGYVQTYKPKDSNKQVPNAMWKKQGPLMLAKCAEALALRKAFPQDMSGLYTTDEYHAGNEIPAAPPADEEVIERLKTAIDALPEAGRGDLREWWKDEGIPALATLPVDRVGTVFEKIREIDPSVIEFDPLTGEKLDEDDEVVEGEIVEEETTEEEKPEVDPGRPFE